MPIHIPDVRKIDIDLSHRVETGATQFGNDWPGLFVRGDWCIELAQICRIAIENAGPSHPAAQGLAERLLELIEKDVIPDEKKARTV